MFEYKTEGGDPTCTLCDKPVTGRCVYWQNGWPLHEKCFEKVQHIIKLHTDYMRWLHTESLPPGTHFTPWVDYRLAEMQEREIKHLREKLEKLQDWTQKEMDRRFGIQHSKVNRLEDEKTTAINKLQMRVDELERRIKYLEAICELLSSKQREAGFAKGDPA